MPIDLELPQAGRLSKGTLSLLDSTGLRRVGGGLLLEERLVMGLPLYDWCCGDVVLRRREEKMRYVEMRYVETIISSSAQASCCLATLAHVSSCLPTLACHDRMSCHTTRHDMSQDLT